MKERCVKSYRQYLKKLKERFGEIKQMPSDDDVRAFVKQYDLDKDWQIVVSEVKADISQLIPKRISTYKGKRISTYKGYLEKLKEEFGIPDTMPDISRIESFIEEYNLEKIYRIKADDVRKDLESFIAGNYDDMIMDAVQDYKPSVKRYVSQPYKSVSMIHTPTHTISVLPKPSQPKQKPQAQSNRQNIQKSESSKSKRNNQKSKGKERNAKQGIEQETILIDGDNHINEGEKGIEKTTKDTKVRAFFSQEGAKKKFDRKYKERPNVSSELVKPGDQAVDNHIKSEADKLLKYKTQEITIISQDKGYDKYIEKMKKSGKHISRAKSVRDRTKKEK